MGLLESLTMLLLSMWLFSSSIVVASLQLSASTISNARSLDARLQDYAYQALINPTTGQAYDGSVPSDLSGILVSALRLRSGSLRRKGVRMYKEFDIPVGVSEEPYVERLVLVYQNLGSRSTMYYPLEGYMYLAPVLGLLPYDGMDLRSNPPPELDFHTTKDPISIKFKLTKEVPNGSVPKCVSLYLNGTVNFSDVSSDNTCKAVEKGHFSIVIESNGPSPSPLSPVPLTPPRQGPTPQGQGGGNDTKVWKIVGSVVGGFALLAILGLLVIWLRKFKQRKKMHGMEKAAEVGESLHMTSVGSTKAPAATGTRTQPTLETEYVP